MNRKNSPPQQPVTATPFMFFRYLFITLLLFGLVIWTTSMLDDAPRMVLTDENERRPGWKSIRDQNQPVTLNVPANWTVMDGSNILFPELERVVYEALSLFRDADEALAIELTAYSPPNGHIDQVPPAFIAVAESSRLQALTAVQLSAFIKESRPEFQNVELLERHLLPQQVNMLVGVENGSSLYNCQMRFSPGTIKAFIIIACAMQPEYPKFSSELEIMLDSFQELIVD